MGKPDALLHQADHGTGEGDNSDITPSSLPSEPWKAFRLLVWRWISSGTFAKAVETQRRSWSLKQSRNFTSHPPSQSIPKNGPFNMACYTSMVIFMSHQLQTSIGALSPLPMTPGLQDMLGGSRPWNWSHATTGGPTCPSTLAAM